MYDLIANLGGRCPTCDELLAPGYTFLLLEEARRTERLQHSFVHSLRRLEGLPGNLSLDVASVLRNALGGVDPSAQLADDRALIHQRASELPERAEAVELDRRVADDTVRDAMVDVDERMRGRAAPDVHRRASR